MTMSEDRVRVLADKVEGQAKVTAPTDVQAGDQATRTP